MSEFDSTFFVLTVDLWDKDATQEVNLVRHSNSSPAVSISAATTAPYPPPPERPYLGILTPAELQAYYASTGDAQTAAQLQPYVPQGPGGVMTVNGHAYHPQRWGYPQHPQMTQQMSYQQATAIPLPIMPIPQAGMFTRNLIGSLSVNAFKLQDDKGETGFWFILQDLSVRTEGLFRYVIPFHPFIWTDGILSYTPFAVSPWISVHPIAPTHPDRSFIPFIWKLLYQLVICSFRLTNNPPG
jgi:hypothetical protein